MAHQLFGSPYVDARSQQHRGERHAKRMKIGHPTYVVTVGDSRRFQIAAQHLDDVLRARQPEHARCRMLACQESPQLARSVRS
ncbi:MAG: hypothetical protein V1790_11970 [Planctomycetota bacterium]